ncbi:DUF1499 domain-containing protein [Gracilimonas sp.]|uniref:DUF1499 domain-containing protein n=1 Tax=Gracilimonas sp. TaxID=1974203 RepID=UPI002871110F|nr:DUF1499 domain-containing protein [Gracilimonas sp.]
MKANTANNLITWGASLAIIGALTVLLSGYGYQWGWWHFSTGFSMIPWGTGGAVLGGIIAAIGFFKISDRSQNQTILGYLGIALALIALLNIGYWYLEIQKGYPPIHDISTDTLNPPEFDAIVPLRADAPNPPEYVRGEAAAAQEAYYGDIEPIEIALNYDEAYDRALETANDMSWTLVDENRQEGRIEAYDKVAWYGFIDDVVIRVDTTETGSRIDIRSKSRIGRGDLGVNAKRIRTYIDEFNN